MFKKLCLWSCLSWFAIGCATSEPTEAPDPAERAAPALQREGSEAALCEEGLAGEAPAEEEIAACVEGQTRYRTGSGCCCNYDNPDAPKSRGRLLIDKCINGAWVYQGGVCDGANCGGICPV